MAEPVEVDDLPVELNKTRQKKWGSGLEGQEQVREEIRALRRDVWVAESDNGVAPDSYNDLFGDDH